LRRDIIDKKKSKKKTISVFYNTQFKMTGEQVNNNLTVDSSLSPSAPSTTSTTTTTPNTPDGVRIRRFTEALNKALEKTAKDVR